METLPSGRAAVRLHISVQKFHRLTAAHGINPVFQGTGKRGEKFWNPADIDRLADLISDGDAA